MFALLTRCDGNNKRVFPSRSVQVIVPDVSSIFSGHSHAALQSQDFGCVQLFNQRDFRLYQRPFLIIVIILRGT